MSKRTTRKPEPQIPTPGYTPRASDEPDGVLHRLPGFVRVLLHIRYVFGYLAGGFLVSAPLRFVMDWKPGLLWPSLVVGAVATLLFVMLIPLSQIAWEKMLLPEYKLFELKVLRSSVFACLFLIPVFLILAGREPDGSGMESFYNNALKSNFMCLVFMVFGYIKVKADTWLFPEFYGLTKDEEEEDEGDEETTSSGFYPARPSAPPAEPDESAGAEETPKAQSEVEPGREAEDEVAEEPEEAETAGGVASGGAQSQAAEEAQKNNTG